MYDPAICHLSELHGRFAEELYVKSPIPRSPSRRKQITEEHLMPMLEGELTSEAVWEIVCRWHTIRLLFVLYCDSSIQAAFSRSAISSWYDEEARKDEEFAREMPLPVPSGASCQAFTRLSTAQRQRSYQRFYKAVIAHWVAVEMLWFAKVQVYESPRQCDEIFKHVWDLWIDNQRPLQEKIDIVEVVDFVWNFLGRKNFSVSSIPDWLDGEGERFQRKYLDEYETEESNWAFFAECVTQYLRPSNIIELLLLSTLPLKRCWSFHQPSYLRRLGFFDVEEGVIAEDTDDSVKAEVHFPLNAVDLDVERGICSNVLPDSIGKLPLDGDYEMEVSEEASASSRGLFAAKWKHYRMVIWPLDSRAQVLFREESSDELTKRILGNHH
jgi:hypothetical protein